MSYYEGILVTDGDSPNAAAIGAEIEDERFGSRIYLPSDTGRKLEEEINFTFSLTDEPVLFFKAALTGHDESDESELSTDGLVEEDGYLYPVEATKIYFCNVVRTKVVSEEDRYGEANIKLIEAEIVEEKGNNGYIGRENPLVDAMVYASRMLVADEGQKVELKKKIEDILDESESELKRKIFDFVEAKIDEV
ncbi:MAG: DUF447 domain-containing protein [Candidatus Natronoplasma sp.]